MSTHRRRRVVPTTLRVLCGVALGVLGCGVAFAYWTSTGSGAGAATTTTAAVLTVTSGTPSATLYPGTTSAVVTKISNSGAANVRVSSIALASTEGTAGFDVDASHPDCGTDSLSFSTQTNGGAGWTVPAGGSLTVTMNGALAMAADADNECQGATFTVHLKVAS